MRLCIPLAYLAACTSVGSSIVDTPTDTSVSSGPDAPADAPTVQDASNDVATDVSDAGAKDSGSDGRHRGNVDHSRLRAECGVDLPACPPDQRCVRFTMNPDDPELAKPRCMVGFQPCDIITCFEPYVCYHNTIEDIDSGQAPWYCQEF